MGVFSEASCKEKGGMVYTYLFPEPAIASQKGENCIFVVGPLVVKYLFLEPEERKEKKRNGIGVTIMSPR